MKLFYKISLIMTVVVLGACGNNWLDLEPTTAVSTEKSISSLRDAQASVIGLYYLLATSSGSYEGWGGIFMFAGDVGGDDMRANGGTKRTTSYYSYRYTPLTVPSTTWNLPYRVLRNANNILNIIDDIEVLESERADLLWVKGQTLAIRALCHFTLSNTFGFPYLKDNGASLGAPLAMENIPTEATPERNTVREMYDAMEQDLLAAIPLMKVPALQTVGQLNKLAAQQLLARVYLYRGEWQKAYDMAKEVIDGAPGAGYRLFTQDEYVSRAAWKTKNLAEGLFTFQWSETTQSDNTCVPFLLNDNTDGYDDYVYTSHFYNSFADGDIRRESITKVLPGSNSAPFNNYYCVKYGGVMTPNDGKVRQSNVPILRLTESYLIAAEASTHLPGVAAQGLAYFNAIHTRAGLEAMSAITLDDVLEERRFELVGEGHRKWDLLRNGKTIVRHMDEDVQFFVNEISVANGNVTLDWNNPRVVLPIPQSELDINPNIVQNPLP